MRVSEVETVARAVLPEFYSGDLHSETWRVFSSCGRLMANPRVMVEEFLKDYLGADLVLGTEIDVYRGRATGFVTSPGVLVGRNKAEAFSDSDMLDIGLGDRKTFHLFMKLCKFCCPLDSLK